MLLRKPLKLGNVTPGGTVHPEKTVRAGVPGTAPRAGLLWGRLSSATHPAPDPSKSRERELMVTGPQHTRVEAASRRDGQAPVESEGQPAVARAEERSVLGRIFLPCFCKVALAHRHWHTDCGVNI